MFGNINYYGSINYREGSDLLAITGGNLSTGCWYINKLDGGTASVNANLRFSNGQTASVAADGKLSVFRPTAEIIRTDAPFFYTLSNTNILTSTLKLGDSEGNGSMSYWVGVHSKYSGSANITQLVTMGCSDPFYNFSDERCDGTEFYSVSSALVFDDGSSLPLGLDDGPNETWEDPNTVSLSARDFVRFCPGGDGIFVTLGIITWNTKGQATQDSMYGNWLINSQTVSGPTGPDTSDEFPSWTTTITAH